MAEPDSGRMQVAVGVVLDAAGERVLLARRPDHVPHGGLWEFPGGKRQPGESRLQALGRELLEELNITLQSARPLITIDHDYPDRAVHLDVWRVESWTGEPCGREGQELAWVPLRELRTRRFPEGNRAILSALELPPLFLVTPDLDSYDDDFFRQAEVVLAAGVRLMQFRSLRLPERERAPVIARLAASCRAHGARLLVNGTPAEAIQAGAHGIQLTASRLMQCNERPLARDRVVAASCHSAAELLQASRLQLDFVVLGPVCATGTHPDAEPLGWPRFNAMVKGASLPVYALGGLGPWDAERARSEGAQGLAMISGIWAAEEPAAAVQAALSAG